MPSTKSTGQQDEIAATAAVPTVNTMHCANLCNICISLGVGSCHRCSVQNCATFASAKV